MKKNRMMRLASGLLVLTLLTTCIISGTFAKYTTEAEGSDTAKVAKWGVTLKVSSDLFANAYKDASVQYTESTATVKAKAENQNVVAPGTKGSGLEIKNTAASEPEVSYEMKIKLADDTAKMPNLKYTPTGGTATTYEPVKFSVLNDTTPIKANLTLAELKTLFNGTNAIYKYNVADGKYYADTDGDGTIDDTPLDTCPNIQIKWEWAYEDTTNKALYDELDTILGNVANGSNVTEYSGGGENSISDSNTDAILNWTVTATQID